MPQRCRVCAHPNKQEIEKQIVQGIAHTRIGKRYGVSHDSIGYHAEHHLSETLAMAHSEQQKNHALDLFQGITDTYQKAERILQNAISDKNPRLALEAMREMRSITETMAKLMVKVKEYEDEHGHPDKQAGIDYYRECLKKLNLKELTVLTALVDKMQSGSNNYTHTPEVERYIDEFMLSEETDYSIIEPVGGGKKLRRTKRKKDSKTPLEDRNTSERASDDFELGLDDLELESLDEGTIPSELTDPKWLVEEHRRQSF